MSVPTSSVDAFSAPLAGVSWRPTPTLAQRVRAALGDAVRALSGLTRGSGGDAPEPDTALSAAHAQASHAGGFMDSLPLWREGMDAATLGMTIKYIVQRVDGTDAPGGRHHGDELFVLNLTSDPYAQVAIRYYAQECQSELPLLARDLFERYGRPPDGSPMQAQVLQNTQREGPALEPVQALPQVPSHDPAQVTDTAPDPVSPAQVSPAVAEPGADRAARASPSPATEPLRQAAPEPAPEPVPVPVPLPADALQASQGVLFAELAQREAACGDAGAPPDEVLASAGEPAALAMLLFCPVCHTQHVDAPAPGWTNPPHRTHQCGHCHTRWRPADVPTSGVAAITTRGSSDTWPMPSVGTPAPAPAAGVGGAAQPTRP